MLSCGHIELKSMPWARHNAAVERSFAQRPALMRTNSIEGVERSLNIKQRDNAVAGDIFTALAGRELTCRGDTLPVGHRYTLPGVATPIVIICRSNTLSCR